MSTGNEPDAATPVPSSKNLAAAVAVAVLGAGLILVTVVLPAEYGIDPLGTGKALGLSAIANPDAMLELVAPPEGVVLAPVHDGAIALYPGEYKVDAREFVLGPYEYVEYKYHLAQDAQMLFSWSASAGVMHDFHGDRDGGPANTPETYDDQPRQRADGSFTAPFSGIHGWYWENPGGETITVRVATAGFYTAAHEFRFDGTRESRPIRDLETIELTDD
jgi:hypothetical protein